jgi:hypothetical protein
MPAPIAKRPINGAASTAKLPAEGHNPISIGVAVKKNCIPKSQTTAPDRSNIARQQIASAIGPDMTENCAIHSAGPSAPADNSGIWSQMNCVARMVPRIIKDRQKR